MGLLYSFSFLCLFSYNWINPNDLFWRLQHLSSTWSGLLLMLSTLFIHSFRHLPHYFGSRIWLLLHESTLSVELPAVLVCYLPGFVALSL